MACRRSCRDMYVYGCTYIRRDIEITIATATEIGACIIAVSHSNKRAIRNKNGWMYDE